MIKIINVGMSQIEVSSNPETVLMAPGLGSCIGLAIFDTEKKIGGMAHVVLPDSSKITKTDEPLGKYADTAVPELFKRLEALGANNKNYVIKIAGGSQMFNFKQESNVLNIGCRNIIAVKAALTKHGASIKKADTGGNKGRTFKLDLNTGKFSVKIIGQDEIEI